MARLSGTWTLTAIAKLAAWDQCVVITGSTNADGAHPMVAGTVITNVRGIDFEVKSQAFNPVMGQWLDSFQIEVMSWDPVKGVMLTISADDKPTPPRPTSTIWSSSAPQPIQSLRRRGSKGRAWT